MVELTPTKRQIFAGDRPFRLGIFAGSGSGKSHLIKEILLNRDFDVLGRYEPDHIFVICPTLKLDTTYNDIKTYLEQKSTKDHQFDEYKQFFDKDLEQNLVNTYKMIMTEQQGKKQGGIKLDAYLIICDDIALELPTQQQSNELTRILTKIRHLNTSIIVSLQHYKSLSSMGRNQLSHIIVFNISLNDELKKISNEVRGNLSSKQFDQILNHATKPSYGYLLILTFLPVSHRFFIGQGGNIHQIEL